MSRIGNQAVEVPQGVVVSQTPSSVTAKGPRGVLRMAVPNHVSFEIGERSVVVRRTNDSKPAKACHGLGRALLNNMVKGVSAGFERRLDIVGVGYKAEMKGTTLLLSLGFSHSIEFKVPAGVEIKVEKGTSLLIAGIDKQQVGQVAAVLRGFRAPDAYKGKGVRYANETIRLKAGKAGTK